jgi:Holliday junction resolvase RusA-like endonuclease
MGKDMTPRKPAHVAPPASPVRAKRASVIESVAVAQSGAQRATAYSVRLSLPVLPPSVNHMYKSIGHGRKALTDEALSFREEVWIQLRHQPAPPAKLPLVLNIWFCFGNKRTQDGDNRIKALQDAIALALNFNDSQIIEWHVYVDFTKQASCMALLEGRTE